MNHIKRKNGSRNAIKVIQNMRVNNQLRNEKGGCHHALFSAILRPLHSITNEEQYKKHLCNQFSYYKNMGNKYNSQHRHMEAASHYHELTPCIVSEKNWNTKQDKGKFMICVLYVLQLAKRHISGRSNVEQ